MATVTYIRERKQTPSAMAGVIAYCSQELKTVDGGGRRYLSGVNCTGDNALTEFLLTKESWRKTDGINFYQYVQSFSPEEGITYAQAHEIALEFAAKAWPGHEVLVATHCDAPHPHSHFVINSVSFENGKKLRQSPNTLKQLRKLSDELCAAHGFSVLKSEQYVPDGTQKMSAREYRAAEKGQSWKLALTIQIEDAMKAAASKEEFISLMEAEGCGVRWTPDRKNITYLCPNGMKCRDNKLHESKFTKEMMEYEFRIRAEIARGIAGADAPGAARRRKRRPLFCRDRAELEGLDSAGAGSQRAAAEADSEERFADDGGRDEQSDRLADGSIQQSDNTDGDADGSVSEEAGGGSRSIYERGENGALRFVRTGWERERLIFLRAAERALRDEALSPQAVLDLAPAHGLNLGLAYSLGAVAAVATAMDVGSEDPEEQRRRIEAQRAGETVGLILGAAILLTELMLHHGERLAEEENVALRPEEQTAFVQSEPEPFFHAEEDVRMDAKDDELPWKEGDGLTFEL